MPVLNLEKLKSLPLQTDVVTLQDLIKCEDGVTQAFDISSNLPPAKLNLYSGGKNSFIATLLSAWDNHRPLVLSPDHFWLLILQGVSAHVAKYSEDLRPSFVTFPEEKKTLEVERHDFVLDSPKNDWSGVVKEFRDQLTENTVKSTAKLLMPQFSTTSEVQAIAAQVALMDICQSYFSYVVVTKCGFPSVTMQGQASDWSKLRQQAEDLFKSGKLKPSFGRAWKQALEPILCKLEEEAKKAGEGVAAGDREFWNSMVKRQGIGGSGGISWLDGWFNAFFPYWGRAGRGRPGEKEHKAQKNPLCFSKEYEVKQSSASGLCPLPLSQRAVPTGLFKAPAIWRYYSILYTLSFYSGFLGYSEDKETGALTPLLGWFIVRRGQENQTKTKHPQPDRKPKRSVRRKLN